MKYDNVKAFEKHLEGASPQHFADVYLIMGKESIDSKDATQLLLRYLLPNNRDLSLQTFDGNHVTADEILLELNSLSFLVPKKGVLIQQADKCKKGVQEALELYMAKPQRSVHLILIASSLTKTSNFYKKIEKVGVVLELAELKPWEKEKHAVEWVNKQAAAARKVMAYPVCQLLVKYSGADQNSLAKEFEKLLCFIGEKKDVTQQDIEAICTNSHSQTIWQLGEAIFRFDASSALSTCMNLLDEGQALLPLLRQIRNQLQTGYQISTILAQEDGKISEITDEYPYMKGQILDRNIQQAKHYGVQNYKLGLIAVDEAEMQAKNSQIDDNLIAELLMIKLSTRRSN
ncbi:MAG: DNA polymerase III subunit delta [Parachlamydiaceae bacterium]|nr:DNA polymerase III subunit delta [Parachlamydiaceae bacterium]